MKVVVLYYNDRFVNKFKNLEDNNIQWCFFKLEKDSSLLDKKVIEYILKHNFGGFLVEYNPLYKNEIFKIFLIISEIEQIIPFSLVSNDSFSKDVRLYSSYLGIKLFENIDKEDEQTTKEILTYYKNYAKQHSLINVTVNYYKIFEVFSTILLENTLRKFWEDLLEDLNKESLYNYLQSLFFILNQIVDVLYIEGVFYILGNKEIYKIGDENLKNSKFCSKCEIILKDRDKVTIYFSSDFQLDLKYLREIVSSYIELVKKNEVNIKLAIADPLTGVYNRRYGEEMLKKMIANAIRLKTSLSIAIIDIDNFKTINDNYGHLVGDEVLKIVGRSLLESVRKSDIVYRYGGDEFVIICLNATKEMVLESIIPRIKFKIKEYLKDKEHLFKLTFSAGISDLSEFIEEGDITSYFLSVDEKLYKAKREGKNKIVI